MNDDLTLAPPEPLPPPEPPAFHKIFIGKDGLRAGWSLLIFMALFAAIIFCANVIGHKLHPLVAKGAKTVADISVTPRLFIVESIVFLVTLLITWIMSKIERRPNSVYGLGGRRKFRDFLAGLAWGVTCLSLLVLTLRIAGLLVIDGRLLDLTRLPSEPGWPAPRDDMEG